VSLAERAAGPVHARRIESVQSERVQVLQLLVRERVVDLRQVHVGGLDLCLAVRHLARPSRGHRLAP
jgi:hypothetical protein